jgi:hypothetical protein
MKCRCKNSKEVFICPDKYNCDKNPVFKPIKRRNEKIKKVVVPRKNKMG